MAKIIPHPKNPKLPKGSGFMHLTLCFSPDGGIDFYPDTDDPQRLVERPAWIVNVLHENPERILCAAGACGGKHGCK
jgi:hypothetical protein